MIANSTKVITPLPPLQNIKFKLSRMNEEREHEWEHDENEPDEEEMRRKMPIYIAPIMTLTK